ncbi:MAG: hypothetical protein Kow0031_35800 [Anaerolineae bacterium]
MAKAAYTLYRLAGLLVPRLPARPGYALCRAAGGLGYRFNRRARATIRQNIRRVAGPDAPPQEIDRLTRLAFNHVLYNYFDLFRLPALGRDAVDKLVTVHGWDNVEQALAAGKGIVMTSAHLGNIEVVLTAMLLRGLSITIPVERIEPPELFDYVTRLRTSQGLQLIPIDGPLLPLLRTLKKGGVAGLAGDRDITRTGQVIPFFGHPARMPDGHVRLALKTGAPLVLGFSHRNPNHTYQARFLPPYNPPQHGTEEEQVAAALAYVVQQLEQAIAQAPEQWTVTVSVWENP